MKLWEKVKERLRLPRSLPEEVLANLSAYIREVYTGIEVEKWVISMRPDMWQAIGGAGKEHVVIDGIRHEVVLNSEIPEELGGDGSYESSIYIYAVPPRGSENHDIAK